MRISLDFTKSVEENASYYFEQAKIAKKKAQGALEAIEESKKKLKTIEEDIKKKEEEDARKKERKALKKEWFEKFRWFYTSEDFLVIGGRDATTNEIVIKKHTDKDDLVFHSELPGSPFVVLKTEGKKPSQLSIEEAAMFTAAYSKAWGSGRGTADIFYVTPEQVSKEAPSGEFIGKGSFMIYGKKNIMLVSLKLFVGRMKDTRIMSGPETAVKKHCDKHVQIFQGNDKTSNIAKKLKQRLETEDVDEILRVIPQGSKA